MSDLGPLGFVRGRQIRRLTNYQAALSAAMVARPWNGTRRLTDYQATLSKALVIPPSKGTRRLTDHQAWQAIPWHMSEQGRRVFRKVMDLAQPETYWTRPIVMDGKRGRIYWQLGINGPYKTAGIPQSARDPDGWRWYGPGIQQLKFAVSAGPNSLTLTLKHSTDTQPRPTARILANGALGIEAISIEFPSGVGLFHTRTFYFNATTAGVVILQLEWLMFEEDATCVWQGLSVSD